MDLAKDALRPGVDFAPEEWSDVEARLPLKPALRASEGYLHIGLRVSLRHLLHCRSDHFIRQFIHFERRALMRNIRQTTPEKLLPCLSSVALSADRNKVQNGRRSTAQLVAANLELPALRGAGVSLHLHIRSTEA